MSQFPALHRVTLLAFGLLAGTLPALAADRWEEAGSGAVAILPPPLKATEIVGGSLVCAEQSWSFQLRAERLPQAAAHGRTGVVTINDTQFSARIVQTADSITIPVLAEAVDAMKSGTKLSIIIEGSERTNAVFSLKGSEAVIEALAARCSQIDMSAYQAVALLETGPAVEPARLLLGEEAKLFRAATEKDPVLSAVTVKAPGGGALLFASLCGSTRYYGLTGCTLRGFARENPGADWREVYNSEGMALYTDRQASPNGWPALVTLPLVGATEPIHWAWTGAAYAFSGDIMAEGGELRGTFR